MLYGEHTSRLLYGGQRGDSQGCHLNRASSPSSRTIIFFFYHRHRHQYNFLAISTNLLHTHTQIKGENVSMIKLAEFWVRPGYGGQFRRGGH